MKRLIISCAVLIFLLSLSPVRADSPIVGEVRTWTTNTAPAGWLICDGSALDRTTYSDLYGVIGITYGAGNGSTTFNLPNTLGRNIIGRNVNDGQFAGLNTSGGEKSHTLTISEVPSHTHTITINGAQVRSAATSGSGANNVNNDSGFNTGGLQWLTQPTGGSGSHNVLDPYIVMNFIIYTGVGLPTATPTQTPTSTATPTETPTPNGTYTPQPTYTPWPTYTPMPTYTPNPSGGGTGPISGTITGSIVITQALPGNAFTTTLTTGNELVWFRSASYGEIIAGSGGLMGFMAMLYIAVTHFATKRSAA